MDAKARALLEEVQRREAVRQQTDALCRAIYRELFDRQQHFHDDKGRRKAVLGSRRAGKTEMWARILTMNGMQHPRSLQRVWSHARLRAKELLWDQFRYLHGRHGIAVQTNETELSVRFPNDAVIRLVGADKDKEVQKKRGDKTLYEVLLEVQSWDQMLLKKTVEDVVSPSLFDLDGTVCLEGTPGPIPVGYWFEVSGGEDAARTWNSVHRPEWRVHRWTMLDNPFLADARRKLEEEKKSRRWTDDNPTYVREYLGRWVRDDGSLYYPFDELRNTYDPERIKPYGKGWTHALGWDLGSRDDMAVVIWGWHEHDPNVYEVFSWKKPGALADEVMSVIDRVETGLGLNLIEQVADTGGGGKMYVEEVMSRYTRRFTAAKKTQKAEHARLFGDDLRTGHIKLVRGGPYAMEIAALLRDPDWDPNNLLEYPGPPEEDPRCANHLSDAGLYAWRAARHYFARPEPPPEPKRGTKEHLDRVVEQLSKRRAQGTVDVLDEESAYGFGAEDD